MGIKLFSQIEHYKIIEQLDKTPYWELFAAEDESVRQQVWLLRILPDLSCSETFINDFAERAQQLSLLDHPKLLKILEYGDFDGSPYLIMDSFPSKSYSELTTSSQPVQKVAQDLLPVAEALTYLHENDVVHGQVSGQSIRINDNQIRLMNYGFSDLLEDEIRRHMPQEILSLGTGDLGYLSPEQIMGKETTPQSDIYALGILLFEASTGTKPFPANSSLEQVEQQMQNHPAWPDGIHKKLPSHAIRLIQKALAKDPVERFDTMKELTVALGKLSQGKKAKVSLSASLRKRLPRRKSLKITFRVLGSYAVLAALVAAGFLSYNHIPVVHKFIDTRLPNKAPVAVLATPSPTHPDKTAMPASSPTVIPTAPAPVIEITEVAVKEIPLPVIQGQNIPKNLSVIQPENASKVQEISRLGMGKFGQVAWHPDNSRIALATSSGVYIFSDTNLADPYFINTGDWADSVEFSSNGILLTIGLRNGDVLIWDVPTKTIQFTLTGHTQKVSDLVFSTNNRYLFSASFDRTVKMWDVAAGTEIKTIVAHSQPIRSIDVSRDGRFLVTGANDRLVKLWDVASSKSLKEFPIPAEAWSVAISPDSEYIASGGADGVIRQWAITSFQLRNEPIVNSSGVWSIQFDKQGNNLFYFTDRGEIHQTSVDGSQHKKMNIHLLNRPVRDIADALGGNFEYLRHEAVSPNGNMIALSTWDGDLTIFGVKTNAEINSIKIEFDDLHQLAFSPDNQYIAAGGERHFTTLWRIPNSHIVNIFERTLPGGYPFSPNSDMLAFATANGYIETVDVKTGKNIITMGESPNGANVLFLRDGNMLSASTIDQTKVWDVPAKVELYQKSGRIAACRYLSAQHDDEFLATFTKTSVFQNQNPATNWICSMLERNEVNLATTNADQTLLAFTNSDGLLELWNAETMEQIWRSPSEHPINKISISPDSSTLASGSTDGSITFWDVNNGQSIFTLDGSYAKVKAMQFSPDGKWLATASSDGIIRLWGVVER